MKKNIISLMIGIAAIASSSNLYADNLLAVYQQAQANDPVVLKAQAQFMASREGIEQARAVLLPQINATAIFGDSEFETISDGEAVPLPAGQIYTAQSGSSTFGASINMQLYHHDSWLRMDNAKKSAHRSDIAYQAAKQELIVRVTQAYFNVLSAQDDLQFATAEKAAIERQLEQTKQRYAVGLTAITDVHEAQAKFDNALTAEIRSNNSVLNAEEGLRVITNVYPRNLSSLNTDRFTPSKPTPESANEWQQTAEAKNLDIISQKIAVDIAKENINIARSGHYPTLDFRGIYSNQENSSNNNYRPEFTGPNLDSHSVEVTLTVPIYSGGATSSAVRKAQNNYVVASQELALTHRDVVRNTRNAYNTVIAAVSAIKSLEQSVISAESALKATEAGFEVGTRTIVDVLDSTQNLYSAKRNLSSTRYSYIQSVLTLKRAGGTITESDINNINQGLTAK